MSHEVRTITDGSEGEEAPLKSRGGRIASLTALVLAALAAAGFGAKEYLEQPVSSRGTPACSDLDCVDRRTDEYEKNMRIHDGMEGTVPKAKPEVPSEKKSRGVPKGDAWEDERLGRVEIG